jgi:hypothetical protein
VEEEMCNGGRGGAPSRLQSAFMIALCFVMPLAAGCRRVEHSTDTIFVRQQLTPKPARVGPAVIAIELTNTSAKPLSHATITVEADMSHPGMAPVFSEAKETVPGTYQATINFNMGGDWVVLLHIKLADGQKVERRMDVGGVRSN